LAGPVGLKMVRIIQLSRNRKQIAQEKDAKRPLKKKKTPFPNMHLRMLNWSVLSDIMDVAKMLLPGLLKKPLKWRKKALRQSIFQAACDLYVNGTMHSSMNYQQNLKLLTTPMEVQNRSSEVANIKVVLIRYRKQKHISFQAHKKRPFKISES